MTISHHYQRYHEERAAIVAAVQGAMLLIDEASLVGVIGDEGYYILPKIDCWNKIWRDTLFEIVKKYPNIIIR